MSTVHLTRDDGLPCSVDVSPWYAAPARLPADTVRFVAIVPLLPETPALLRVADHVTGWRGFTYRGEPLSCTRASVVFALRAQVGFLEDIVAEIDRATASGVLL